MRVAVLTVALIACGGSSTDVITQCDPPRGDPMNRFADVTAESGVAFTYATPDFKGAGLTVADLDNDGLPEIIAARRIGGLKLFHNRGGLRFEETTAAAGLDPLWTASALAAADLDNDGDLDLVIAGDNQARVMTNRGDGTFEVAAMFADSGTTEHVLPVDLDGDGLLDLYFSNYDLTSSLRTVNRTFHNMGGLQFTLASLAGGGRSWSATAFDLEGDGDQDLYIANDTLLADFGSGEPMSPLPVDLLLRNDGFDAEGMIHYTDLASPMNVGKPRSSMGGLLADFNDDGLLDLFVPNYGAKKLFLRDAANGFTESAAQFNVAGIGRDNERCTPDTSDEECLLLSWSAAFSDFDLDGYDELFVVNGATRLDDPPPVLTFTRGDQPVFHELTADIACLDARALAVTDLDGDGDQDLVIAQKSDPLVVYENQGTPATAAWLRVTLRGVTSNREGIGALVTVHLESGRSIVKPIGAGGVIHSSMPAEAFFGLGADSVASIDVQWPSGRATHVDQPGAGAIVLDEP
ncbi:MAG: CRTAC1 family protein [Kofleriaceae bacterium]